MDGVLSPPHPVASRPPSPSGGGRGLWRMTLLRLLSRRVGEGAGRPGLARCFDSFTVSTKQTCPAQPFSTRPPAGGPCFGPYRIIRRGHCCPGRGRDMAQPAVRSIGARRAGAGHPSTCARTPEVSFPRASSLDHSPPTSGRWIRRPPHRRDERIMEAARGRLMKQFEKVAGRWKGGGFSGEPDYGLVDCGRSVAASAFVIPGERSETRNPAARESATLSRTPCLNRSPSAPLGPPVCAAKTRLAAG